tara:strand:+ start:7764 stop:7901 length:138 start_codon:yes stop_codon:yes gene_type:complete
MLQVYLQQFCEFLLVQYLDPFAPATPAPVQRPDLEIPHGSSRSPF